MFGCMLVVLIAIMIFVTIASSLSRKRAEKNKIARQMKELERESRIRAILSSPDPFLEAWREGYDEILVNLIFFDFHSAGLLECQELPVNQTGIHIVHRQYRMREGIDHSLFNRWEKRVASHLESYTSLERLITVAGFKDFSDMDPAIVRPAPNPDPFLLERFMALRKEALEDIWISSC